MSDPTQRFEGRAAAYDKARPSYPLAVLDLLARDFHLRAGSVVADLGSGTGIFTAILLERGATVFAVEPNADMRATAEQRLGSIAGFRNVNGRAEATTLATSSVDLVTAAQAYHWFDRPRAHAEMKRILRKAPNVGCIALVWNDRDTTATQFTAAFEDVLRRRCPDYATLQGRSEMPEAFNELFGAGGWSRTALLHDQELDRDALIARAMSTSYAPREGEAHAALISDLRALFDTHEEAGIVRLHYRCVVIGGCPA
ncbi:MAG: class I SAM-dependent methyltransferase [Polyangiaceae bacterium]|nr:class I SAM-dependent methyltransferase [Polyangiaceae bacterium]